MRYTGDFPYVLREIKYARFEPVITLEKGDVVFLPMLTAITITKRKRRLFELVTDLHLEARGITNTFEPKTSAGEKVENDVDMVKTEQTDANLIDPIDLKGIGEPQDGNQVKGGTDEPETDQERTEETVEGDQQTETKSASDEAEDEVMITKDNIMDETVVDMKMIKEACKKHNIKIGNKKRNDLVALLLPYLEK